MNYETIKTILKDKKTRGEITQKQYFKLVGQARARFYKETENLAKTTIVDVFDGKLSNFN